MSEFPEQKTGCGTTLLLLIAAWALVILFMYGLGQLLDRVIR